MMESQRLNDDDLNAYVDGWIAPDRRIVVERRIAEDPELARQVEDYRLQNALLHELFDPVLAEEPPAGSAELAERLQARLAGNDNVPYGWVRPWMRTAAAVVLVVAGAAGGWFGRDMAKPAVSVVAEQPSARAGKLQSFAAEAAAAHRFYTADEGTRGEMQADDPSAINTFLSQRMGREVVGPDLSSIGYRLTAGRSLPTELGQGAQYVYATGDGKRVTLLVGAAQQGKEGAFSYAQLGEMSSYYWVENGFAYALIGRQSRDELMDLTKAVHKNLKTRAPTPATVKEPAPPRPPEKTDTSPATNPIQPVSDTRPKAS